MFSILLGILGFLIALILGMILGVKLANYAQKITEETPLEKLKNALLTLALMTAKSEDFNKELDVRYSRYTGDGLPSLSGCSVENACFTYIRKKEAFRNEMFYSKSMEDKYEAVDKYLQKKLDTDEKVMTFFTAFYEKVAKSLEDNTNEEIPVLEPIVEDEAEILLEEEE